MKSKTNFFKISFSALAFAVLAACGGGGDSTTTTTTTTATDPVTKYSGRWGSTCLAVSGGLSAHYVYTISKWNDTSATGAFQGYGYTNSNCSGAGFVVDTEYNHAFVAHFTGQKTVLGKLADKVVYEFGGGSVNDAWFTDGNTLMMGSTVLGADGFPDSFASMTFRKR